LYKENLKKREKKQQKLRQSSSGRKIPKKS